MKDKLFAVIDVETTGGGINGNRLTEVCIVRRKGVEIQNKYTTLINTEKHIPTQITALKGIDNEMVENAPTFHEVAKEIEEIMRDAIFVAKNATLCYYVIRNEVMQLGLDFK